METVSRFSVAERRKRQYDAFGPWVFEITGPDDLPPAFDPVVSLRDDSLMAFRVPRNVERRNVRPGDDIFEYVVVLDTDHLSVYSLGDGNPTVETLAYQRIQAVSTLYDMINGDELTFFSDDAILTIPFNPVSEELIELAVDRLRNAICRVGPGDGGSERDQRRVTGRDVVPVERMVQLYGNLIRCEREHQSATVWGYQSETHLVPRGFRPIELLLNLIRRKRRRPVLLLATPDGTVIFHGEPQVSRFLKGEYGYRRTEIWSLLSAEMRPDGRYVGGAILNLGVGSHRFSYSVDAERFSVAGERLVGLSQ